MAPTTICPAYGLQRLDAVHERLNREWAYRSIPSSETRSVSDRDGGSTSRQRELLARLHEGIGVPSTADPSRDARTGCTDSSQSVPTSSLALLKGVERVEGRRRGGTEQSSSLLSRMMASAASSRRKPAFVTGGGQTIGAQRARDGPQYVLEVAAGAFQRGDAGENVGQLGPIVERTPPEFEMNIPPRGQPRRHAVTTSRRLELPVFTELPSNRSLRPIGRARPCPKRQQQRAGPEARRKSFQRGTKDCSSWIDFCCGRSHRRRVVDHERRVQLLRERRPPSGAPARSPPGGRRHQRTPRGRSP